MKELSLPQIVSHDTYGETHLGEKMLAKKKARGCRVLNIHVMRYKIHAGIIFFACLSRGVVFFCCDEKATKLRNVVDWWEVRRAMEI